MNLAHQPPVNRVPGSILKPKEYALGKDLSKLSLRELLDLKNRQLNLLENRSRLQKLPDKGQKIQDLYERVVKALELKNEIEVASTLLSSLNLNSKNISNLEWEGTTKLKSQDTLDSDDEEDPLAILSSSNTVNHNRRIAKPENSEEPALVTDEDIREAQEIKNSELHLDPGAEYMCKKENMEPSHRFLPYKSASNTSSNSSASNTPKKLRDNSAATPPVLDSGVKMLSLRESIDAENVYRHKMKELNEKHAAERLAQKLKEIKELPQPVSVKPLNASATVLQAYRAVASLVDESDDSDEDSNNSLSDENLSDEH